MRSSIAGMAIALYLIGCATAEVPPTVANQLQPPQPTDVRIVSAPENGSDLSVARATWALVVLTAALCIVTWVSAKAALRDAIRLRREVLEREVNTAAHRAAATAEHVGQLAASVPRANTRLLSLSNSHQAASTQVQVAVAANQRVSRANEIKQHALDQIFAKSGDKTDAKLIEAQRRLDEHLVQLEVLKEAIAGELEALAREIDAAERETALSREQRRLNERRVGSEVGQCNKLIFILGQMVSTLEDIQEALFDDPKRKLGRDPNWNEIGALVGAPTEAPEFMIGEYAFLLEGEEPIERAPEILGRIYNAEANFKQVLARLNERSLLWHQYNETRAAGMFNKGQEAVHALAASGSLIARLKELTTWLSEDLAEWIPAFKSVFPELYSVLNAKYPEKRFIRFWPKNDPSTPPL